MALADTGFAALVTPPPFALPSSYSSSCPSSRPHLSDWDVGAPGLRWVGGLFLFTASLPSVSVKLVLCRWWRWCSWWWWCPHSSKRWPSCLNHNLGHATATKGGGREGDTRWRGDRGGVEGEKNRSWNRGNFNKREKEEAGKMQQP